MNGQRRPDDPVPDPADPRPAPPARRVRRSVPAPVGASTPPVTGTADPGPVYVVGGGGMVAVFTNPDSAAIQYTVMVGANLDPITRTFSADEWAEMRALLRATVPGLVIVDGRDGGDQ
jgi:hypothetical protein